MFVVLGVLASLIPQVPNIDLSPDVVLVLFLPPLVYNAAFLTAPRETRENAVPITALAVGTTAVTIVGVAWVIRLVLPGLGWAPAFAFAAAIAPTDAVAATAVMSRLGAPTRVVTILEGESLINDAVALTAFSLAVEAIAHPFTVEHALLRLVQVVVGGIAYGLVVAVVIGRVRHHVRDPALQILITLITPFVAYIPAEQLNVSGVLATVVAGVYLGTRTEGMLQPASRVSGHDVLADADLPARVGAVRAARPRAAGGRERAVDRDLVRAAGGRGRRRGRGDHRDPAGLGAGGVAADQVPARRALDVRGQPVAVPARHRLGRHARGDHPGHRAHPADHGERAAVRRTVGADPAGRGRRGGHAAGRGADAGAAGAAPGAGEDRGASAAGGGRAGAGDRGRARPARRAGRGGRGGRGHRQRLPPAVRAAPRPGPQPAQRRRRRPVDTSAFRRELVRAQRDKLAQLYAKGKISDEIRRTIARSLDLQEGRPRSAEPSRSAPRRGATACAPGRRCRPRPDRPRPR